MVVAVVASLVAVYSSNSNSGRKHDTYSNDSNQVAVRADSFVFPG